MNKKFYIAKFGLCMCAIVCATLLHSCYPNGADNIEDFDVVATVPKKDYDYKQNKTYTLPSRIPIVRNTKPAVGDTLPAAVAQPLLEKIRSNMSAYGYTEIKPGDPGRPDVALTSVALQTTYVGAYYPYWWDYWGWYPWGSWGYPWGPGWYPSGIYYYSYDTGSLLINMSTPTASQEGAVNTVWLGAVKGLLDGTTSNVQRTATGIDQAFAQSTYLKTN